MCAHTRIHAYTHRDINTHAHVHTYKHRYTTYTFTHMTTSPVVALIGLDLDLYHLLIKYNAMKNTVSNMTNSATPTAPPTYSSNLRSLLLSNNKGDVSTTKIVIGLTCVVRNL